MRLWSIHPATLDKAGLGAAWREGLMAQSVIRKLKDGQKPGYRNHPQLRRFLSSPVPLLLIGTWLTAIQAEATARGYNYNAERILYPGDTLRLPVTAGQLQFEHSHILRKLEARDKRWFETFENSEPKPHPMFVVIPGEVEEWEKV